MKGSLRLLINIIVTFIEADVCQYWEQKYMLLI